ncbi:MAG: protein arginine kinase [Velocimicrobium sp.]
MRKWYEEEGEYSDVVISSRIRLARNIKRYPFSPKLSEDQAVALNKEVIGKLANIKNESGIFLSSSINKMDDISKMSMLERYVISPAMVDKKQETGLLVAPDEKASIMINEEDHIRIQSLTGTMNIKKALQEANKIDDYLEEKLDIAYHNQYGYLTACPTNVGTGLRASYMVFLPALDGAGKINQLMNEAGRFGVAIRGMYGEGTKASASIYQISNQKTLGMKEEDIIEKLDGVVYQIIYQERKRREYILANNYASLEDQIYRSYGVLKYTKQINTKDAMTLLSQLKFGEDANLVAFKKSNYMFQLMMEIQPGNLQTTLGKIAGSAQRDQKRAQYINTHLPEFK